MSLLTSNVGRKVLMAVSGLFLVLFAVAHLVGNSTIWFGPARHGIFVIFPREAK